MTFNSTKLSNGFTILTYNIPTLQSVAINLIVKVGSRYEESKESGISHFLEHMAFKGTKTRTAKIIAEEFDSMGGYFNAYTGREQTVYYCKVLGNNFSKALDILADIIQNSIFAIEDIKKERDVISQEIAQVQDNPDDLAHEQLYQSAYLSQPLGKSILGTDLDLAKINSTSLKNYLNKHYTAGNMFLSIAGKINHDEAVKDASKLFSFLSNAPGQNFQKAKYIGDYARVTKYLGVVFLLGSFSR